MNLFKRHTKPPVVYDATTMSGILRSILHALRVIVAVGVVITASNLFFVSSSRSTDAHQQRAVDDIVATRTEGRITTCRSDQRFELAHNKLVDGNELFVSTILADAAKTKPADQRPAILSYAAARNAEFELTKVPIRDCSPAGIERFYKANAGVAAVACKHGATGNGFCQ